jgi:hypothetical protein
MERDPAIAIRAAKTMFTRYKCMTTNYSDRHTAASRTGAEMYLRDLSASSWKGIRRLTLSDDAVDDSGLEGRSLNRSRSGDDTVDDSGLVDLDLDRGGSSDDTVDDSSVVDRGLDGGGGVGSSEGVHCRGFEWVGWLVGRKVERLIEDLDEERKGR